jgi:hypothetical protein
MDSPVINEESSSVELPPEELPSPVVGVGVGLPPPPPPLTSQVSFVV